MEEQQQPMASMGAAPSPLQPPAKKSRTNTPWTAAEEQRLKNMREAGSSWADIAKVGWILASACARKREIC